MKEGSLYFAMREKITLYLLVSTLKKFPKAMFTRDLEDIDEFHCFNVRLSLSTSNSHW